MKLLIGAALYIDATGLLLFKVAAILLVNIIITIHHHHL